MSGWVGRVLLPKLKSTALHSACSSNIDVGRPGLSIPMHDSTYVHSAQGQRTRAARQQRQAARVLLGMHYAPHNTIARHNLRAAANSHACLPTHGCPYTVLFASMLRCQDVLLPAGYDWRSVVSCRVPALHASVGATWRCMQAWVPQHDATSPARLQRLHPKLPYINPTMPISSKKG